MLNRKNIINKMKRNFPSWSDIRKRTEKSEGGRLLTSVAEEVLFINEAIEEYKKGFFFEHYEGKEDEIIYYLYEAEIGDVENMDFSLNVPSIKVTKDRDEFKSSNGVAYVSGTKLMLKAKDVPLSGKITYSINNAIVFADTRKIHVWNIYDEFALFMGLKRFDEETNKELSKRIKLESKRPPGNSETGLQNSIMNLLESKGEEVSRSEIKISSANESNIYNEVDGEKIIDKIISANRDVYKEKKWDVDLWNYDFDSTSYMPAEWDSDIDHYQDGVGHNNSLMVHKSRSDGIGKVEISLLKKSEEKIKQYIKNIAIKDNMKISLSKYKNEIKPVEASFRIEARDVLDITNSNSKITGYDLTSGSHLFHLDSVLANRSDLGGNILEQHDKRLEGDIDLTFSNNGNEDMLIRSIYTYEDGEKKSFIDSLSTKWPFFLDEGSGTIKNIKCRFSGKQSGDFIFKQNVLDTEAGMVQKDKSTASELSIDVSGMQNEILDISHSIKMLPVISSGIVANGFEQVGTNSYSGAHGAEMSISIKANKVSFTSSSPVEVTVGTKTIYSNGLFELEETMSQRDVSIKIKNKSSDEVTISGIVFASYDLLVSLEEGEIIKHEDKLMLPNIEKNMLKINFASHMASDISINRVYIGYDTHEDKINIPIEWKESYSGLFVDADCKISLSVKGVIVSEDYKTQTTYTPSGKECFIRLNLSGFDNIEAITPDAGEIVEEFKNGSISRYLYLKSGQRASSVQVSGDRKSNTESKSLLSIAGARQENGDKLYATFGRDFLIMVSDGTSSKVRIKNSDFLKRYNTYEFSSDSEDIEPCFVRSFSPDSIIKSNVCDAFFNYMYVSVKSGNMHVANNKYKSFSKKSDNIEIVNSFLPMMESNKLMYYELYETPGDENREYTVSFSDNNKWSIGRQTLSVVCDIDFEQALNYGISKSFMNKEFILSDYAFIDRYESVIIEDKKSLIDVSEYILESEDGYEIVYSTKPATSNYEDAPDFYCIEKLVPESDGFNKLKYSNIDELIYIGFDEWDGTYGDQNEIEVSMFTVMKKEGIVLWRNESLNGRQLNIVYTIKIPTKVKIPLEKLYTIKNIPAEAYDLVARKSYDVEISDTKKMLYSDITSKDFTDVRLKIDNTNIGYIILEDGIELRNNNTEESVEIEPGYYYIGDKEFYTYISPKNIKVQRMMNLETQNVKKIGEHLITQKSSVNMIRNPGFELSESTSVFNKNYELNESDGISLIRSITACDNFNRWTCVNSKMNLADGLNGLAIELIPTLIDGYAYIKLPSCDEKCYISFFSSPTIKAFIGKRQTYGGRIIKESDLERKSSFYEGSFSGNSNFLVVSGAGVIDDIIAKNSQIAELDHVKNIDKMNISFNESPCYPMTMKLDIVPEEVQSKNIDTRDGRFRTSSSADWDKTPTISYRKNSDWKDMYSEGLSIKENSVMSLSNRGHLKTRPFKVKDIANLNKMYFSLNEIDVESMKDFKVEVLTGKSIDSVSKKCFEIFGNYGEVDGSLIDEFVSFKVYFSENKILSMLDVFCSYRETEDSKIQVTEASSGTVISKVFDIDIESDIEITSLDVGKIIEKENIDIYIRGAKNENAGDYVWTEWKYADIHSSGELKAPVRFEGYRLVQAKFEIRSASSEIEVSGLNLKIEEGEL